MTYLCCEWPLALDCLDLLMTLLRQQAHSEVLLPTPPPLTSPDLQTLEASPSDSFIGELHVAAIWTAHVATDGEGWSPLQVFQVPETHFK